MAAVVTVYSQPNCVQCTATYRALDKVGIEYVKIDVTADPAAAEVAKAYGYLVAPVVVVTDTGEHWGGFRTEKITELAARLASAVAA
jgi:glutaredoxin-like protein NrdH